MSRSGESAVDHGQGARFGVAVAATAAFSVLVAAVYAYCSVFGKFAPYDDQGYLMLTVRGFLEGHPLYESVFTQYGPFYYFYQYGLHALARLPLTHDATGVLCVCHWLIAAGLLAWAAGAMTRSLAVTLMVFLQAVLHLHSLANEPGHPQEIISMLLALAVLVAATKPLGPGMLALLGGMGAALAFTKINVGAFFGCALVSALMCQARLMQSRPNLLLPLLAASSLVPFVLMREHLADSWARVYAWQAGVAILSAGVAAGVFQKEFPVQWPHLAQAGAGCAGGAALLFGLSLLAGISPNGLLDGLVLTPLKLAGVSWLPARMDLGGWSGLLSLLALGLATRARAGLGNYRFAIAVARLLYGLLGGLALVPSARLKLAYLLPWCWLLLLPVPTRSEPDEEKSFSKVFVCMLAGWQSLQAYPVAGTQVAVGTLPSVLIFSLCLVWGLDGLAGEQRLRLGLWKLGLRWPVSVQAGILGGMISVFALAAGRTYVRQQPVQLPGTQCMRLPAEQADLYPRLARHLASTGNTFFTYPGLLSLYFWTGTRPPTYLNVNGETVPLSPRQQQQVVEALHRTKHLLLVVNDQEAKSWTGDSDSRQGPLLRFIHEECRPRTRLGPFLISAPEAAPEPGGEKGGSAPGASLPELERRTQF